MFGHKFDRKKAKNVQKRAKTRKNRQVSSRTQITNARKLIKILFSVISWNFSDFFIIADHSVEYSCITEYKYQLKVCFFRFLLIFLLTLRKMRTRSQSKKIRHENQLKVEEELKSRFKIKECSVFLERLQPSISKPKVASEEVVSKKVPAECTAKRVDSLATFPVSKTKVARKVVSKKVPAKRTSKRVDSLPTFSASKEVPAKRTAKRVNSLPTIAVSALVSFTPWIRQQPELTKETLSRSDGKQGTDQRNRVISLQAMCQSQPRPRQQQQPQSKSKWGYLKEFQKKKVKCIASPF